ncbi:hypothetical protein BRADI_4g21032v3 [Brachypodium distachyon]|uniref:Uncharacterized protein n=1 Tax=Brachypodium distachyon TaxID=15368 RepID=A0A2K2CP42_BRADI|nr:hypothetical protein BRADI_4g21032v3 [Brachypodium distachyon]
MDPASDLITFDSLRRNAPCLNADFRGMLIDRTEGDFDNGVLRPNGEMFVQKLRVKVIKKTMSCLKGFTF